MKRFSKHLIIIIFASVSILMKSMIVNHDEQIIIRPVNYTEYEILGYSMDDLKLLKSLYSDDELKQIIEHKIYKNDLFSYQTIKTFNFKDIAKYEHIRKKDKVSHLAAINLINHPYVMSNFYDNIREALNIDSHLVLVNKNYALSKDYVPENLVYAEDIRQLIDDKSRYYLQEEAYYALKELFTDALKHELILYLSNGYRSYDRQERIYNQYLLDFGNAELFSARPGHSEHQTGLAVDITCRAVDFQLTEKFAETKEGIYLKYNAHLYGFIERYPKDKENITGYMYEPWHLRYVGKEVASIIDQNKLTLEEYLIKYTEMPA